MEKLEPQIEKESLINESYNNYQIAKNYYYQRRQNFRSLIEQNTSLTLDSFKNELNKKILEKWNKEVFNVAKGIYWNPKSNLEDKIQEIHKRFDTSSPQILNWLLYAIKQKNPRTFYSGLGFAFEIFLEEEAIAPIIKEGQNFAQQHITNLLKTFGSGAMKSKSSVVSGIKNIRPDLLLSIYSETEFTKDIEGVLSAPSGLPVEIQRTLQINWEKAVPNADEIMNVSDLLSKFLQPDIGSFYGFSAKSWTDSDGKEFMSSSIIQKLLNQVFNQVDSDNRRHSWEADYTIEYVTYFLSHRIFDIIGPTNIALLNRNGVIWMDDFIETHIFFMQIQMDNFWKKKSGGIGRIYPQINNPGIYVRNYTLSKNSLVQAKEHKTKKDGHYIDLKII